MIDGHVWPSDRMLEENRRSNFSILFLCIIFLLCVQQENPRRLQGERKRTSRTLIGSRWFCLEAKCCDRATPSGQSRSVRWTRRMYCAAAAWISSIFLCVQHPSLIKKNLFTGKVCKNKRKSASPWLSGWKCWCFEWFNFWSIQHKEGEERKKR